MLVVGGRTELRAVEVGLMNDEQAEIREGLAAGQAIVARPGRDIEPGMRVEMIGP